MKITDTSVIKKLLLFFLVIAGLYFGKDFLIPVAIGGVMATLFLPFCKWMELKGVPKIIAVFCCLVMLLAGVAFVFGLLGWQIAELTTDLNLMKQKAVETIDHVQAFIFTHIGMAPERQSQIFKNEQPTVTFIMQLVGGSLLYVITNFILVIAYVLFFLLYRTHIAAFIVKLTPASKHDEMRQVLQRVANVSQHYLLGLGKMIACLWVMYGIGFSVLGVKNALFFAFLCGLLEIVPFIGNITGTTLTLLMAAVQGASLPLLVGILSTYGIVQFIQGWVLEPLILGPQVKINPLFTVVALVLGQLIWGVAGMFLAIPLTAMFKIVCDHVESLNPYGFLIGELKPAKLNSGNP